MTMGEWVTIYEKKTEPYVLESGYHVYFDPDRGFLTYLIDGDILVLDHCCSDHMEWIHDSAKRIARDKGCHFLWTQTMRSPAAFCRHSHAHLDVEQSGYRKNGIFYWVFEERI